MATDRIKLSTAATTIVRAPLGKGKSATGNAAVWGALIGQSRRDLQGDVRSQGDLQLLDSAAAAAAYESSAAVLVNSSNGGPGPGPGPPWTSAGAGGTIYSNGGGLGHAADYVPPSRASIIDHLAHPLTAAVTAGQLPPPATSSAVAGMLGGASRRFGAPSRKSLLPTSHSGVPLNGGGAGGGAGGSVGNIGSSIGGGGGHTAYGAGFRRNGITSAPNAPLPRSTTNLGGQGAGTGGGSTSGTAGEPARLPAIGALGRTATRAESPPAAVNTQPLTSRRNLLALPSIAGGVVIAGGGEDDDEDAPIVVSFAPSKATSNGRGILRGPSRPGRSLTAAVVASNAAAGDGDGDDADGDESTSASASTPRRLGPSGGPGGFRSSAPAVGNGVRTSIGGAGPWGTTTNGLRSSVSGAPPPPATAATAAASTTSGGLIHGIRRFFGGKAATGAAALPPLPPAATAREAAVKPPPPPPPSRHGRSDDTAPLDDTASASSGGGALTAVPPSVAALARMHKQEQERVNRVRYSILADDTARVDLPPGVGVGGAGAGGSGGVAGGGGGPCRSSRSSVTGAGGDQAAVPSSPSRRVKIFEDAGGGGGEPSPDIRSLRSGKSFTQRTIEDPNSPAFKTARQLAALQEKLSYMDDQGWREKAAQSVPMERPILMADGWKL